MAALTERIDPILQNLRGRLQGVNLRQNGIFLALVGLILFFAATTPNAASLTPNNWSNLVVQNGYILVLAIGMVMVIIAGHIDLSVGSVMAFGGGIMGLGQQLMSQGLGMGEISTLAKETMAVAREYAGADVVDEGSGGVLGVARVFVVPFAQEL